MVTVANSSLLNFESSASHNITVRGTDLGGLFYEEIFTINLTDVNETPIAVVDAATSTEASGTANGIAGTNPTGNVLANDTDVDAGDTKTVSGVAAGIVGSAATNVGTGVTGSFGSISIAANGVYSYTVDNNNATVQALAVGQSVHDVFTYTMQDAGGLTSTTQITITIQGANDAPVETSIEGTALGYTENTGAVAITSTIVVTDMDDNNFESAVVAITSNYSNGQDILAFTNQNGISGSWNATTGELTLTGSATVAQYQDALRSITYTNTSESPSTLTRTVTFTVNDGAANSNTQTRDIAISLTNDAPVLDNTGAMIFTTITEDQTANSGNTVASIISSAGGDRITDVDAGAAEGIAVTALTSGNGTWEYSVNGGTNWTAVGAVSDSSALLLRSNDLLRFVPNGQNATTGEITFRAWDQTGASAGQQGTKVDASTSGGTNRLQCSY